MSKLIKALSVEHCVDSLQQADATTWQPESGQQFDLIISETMKAMLRREPQLSVFTHLQQFLKADGQLLPSEVSLDGWLSDIWIESDLRLRNITEGPEYETYQPIHLKRFFQLDLATCKQIFTGDQSSLQGTFTVPNYDDKTHTLKLTTEIRIYKNYVLLEWQSDLTIPEYFDNNKPKPGSEIGFEYRIEPLPKFHFQIEDLSADDDLPEVEAMGELGIVHLKRLWKKAMLEKQGKLDSTVKSKEWSKDLAVMDRLGIGLEDWMAFLYQCDSFEGFEKWIKEQRGSHLTAELIQATNTALLVNALNKHEEKQQSSVAPSVLTTAEKEFFSENGYLIIPSLIDTQQCKATMNVIWQFLDKQADDPASWYQAHPRWQGIMVQKFQHPVLEQNRQSEKLRQVYLELWGKDQLTISIDRVGFNPPEAQGWSFPGPRSHWDLQNFDTPIPFGLQGILYLTDTQEDQGAFSCVPGFHNKIDQWLATLPEGTDPQAEDLYALGAKPIAAKAGDFIIWHHALPHGSSPNTANFPRIVQYINMYPVKPL